MSRWKCAIGVSIFLATAAQGGSTAVLQVGTKGNELVFDHPSLTAKAGQEIRLSFKNNATPDSELSHTWVLVKPGKDSRVAEAAAGAGEKKGFIPDSPDILAHTRLLKPGQRATITFRAPSEPGDYPFLCTVPGHYPSLKGVLHVTR